MLEILGKVKCIKHAYTDDFAEVEPKEAKLNFIQDKVYEIIDSWDGYGWILINEYGEEHGIGVTGDKWFDEHFILLG